MAAGSRLKLDQIRAALLQSDTGCLALLGEAESVYSILRSGESTVLRGVKFKPIKNGERFRTFRLEVQ